MICRSVRYWFVLINMSLTGAVGLLYLSSGRWIKWADYGSNTCMVGLRPSARTINTPPILIGVFLQILLPAKIGSTCHNRCALGNAGPASRKTALPRIMRYGDMTIVSTVGSLHAGTNLYNNGCRRLCCHLVLPFSNFLSKRFASAVGPQVYKVQRRIIC